MAVLLITYLLVDLLMVGLNGSAFIATVIAFLGQWGVMWLAKIVALKRSWPRRHPMFATLVTFFVILIVGAIASSALAAPHTGATPLWRFALTLVVASVFVLLSDYRADVDRERVAQLALRDARDAGAAALTQQREDIVGRLVRMFDDALVQAPAAGSQGAIRVRELAREHIRPLSHDLMTSMPPSVEPRRSTPSPPTWRQILDDLGQTQLFHLGDTGFNAPQHDTEAAPLHHGAGTEAPKTVAGKGKIALMGAEELLPLFLRHG
jgi:hypothetical protein